ncbi:MAG: hypothetical protein NC936_06215 [Candidatus Omnitrophica bacterium]|nr:hypothetical protein [Candidatus Omnitrophota bacterium]
MTEYKPNPGVAAVLSFIFTGLGQLYNGQIKKGLWIIFLSALSIILIIFGAIFIWQTMVNFSLSIGLLVFGAFLFLVGIVLICVLGAYSISDAYNYAQRR